MSRSLELTTPMRRVLILGSSGAGKSTLARQLGAALELPVIHLDRHYWHPGWVGTPPAEWRAKVEKMAQRDAWVMDGNYRSTLDIRLQAADTAVFLDLPQWLCIMRAVKRRIAYHNRPRPDMAIGCRERLFDPDFPRFLHWIWNYPHRARPDVKRRLSQLGPDKQVVWLRSPADVNAFLTDPHNPRFWARPAANGQARLSRSPLQERA